MITKQTIKWSITTAIAFVSSIGVLLWTYYYAGQLRNDLERAQVAVVTHEMHAKNVAVAEKSAALAQAGEVTLQQYVLTEDKTVDFLTDLEALAAVHGVSLTTESLKVVENEDVPHISLQLNGLGTQNNVNDFLENLEALPYASWLENTTWLRTEAGIEVELILNVTLMTL